MEKKIAALRRDLEIEWFNTDDDLPFNTRASPSNVSRILIELNTLNALDDGLRKRTAQWLRFASWTNDDTDGVARAVDCLSSFIDLTLDNTQSERQ